MDQVFEEDCGMSIKQLLDLTSWDCFRDMEVHAPLNTTETTPGDGRQLRWPINSSSLHRPQLRC